MLKCWITYTCWLIAVLILNIFSASKGVFALLCLSVILPLIAIIINRLLKQKIIIETALPDSAEKGSVVSGKVFVTNTKRFLIPFAKLSLLSENMVTGEKNGFKLCFSLTPKGKKEFGIKLSDNYCGKIVFKASNVRFYDIFGLTYKKSDCDVHGSINILPELLDCSFSMSQLSGIHLENSDNSADKPGFDLSEPYEYREYAVGDSPKSIHWKLSQKLDRLIVRQGGMPSPESFILLLDTTASNDKCDYSTLSKTVEAFISLSKELCDRQASHTICFFDYANSELFKFVVNNDGDWFATVPKVLSASFKTDSTSCTERLSDSMIAKPEHIICVSACKNGGENTEILTITPQDFT
ncbi:MAG: DUF58 domain-containing protein [Ruminococcus sp.]|nr:DUF58 domain-containing protein [Ruminococcus sp.]